MALSASTVWEIQTGGSDTNGGGYVSGGTDWSQQASPQYSVTDGVSAGTTTIISATAAFGTDVVGNIMYVAGGTGSITAGWYQITARTNSTTITVDRSTGLTAGTGVTLKIGGALASPGQACANAASGNALWLKAGTYSISSTSNNVSGGRITTPNGTGNTADARIIAYTTTRGDGVGFATLQVASSGVTSITVITPGSDCYLEGIDVDGQSKSAIQGFNSSNGAVVFQRCKARNCTANGMQAGNNWLIIGCLFTGNGGTVGTHFSLRLGSGAAKAIRCEATGNTVDGFGIDSGTLVIDSISWGNTGTARGFNLLSTASSAINCTAYGNGSDGFLFGGSNGGNVCINCVSTGNGGWGFNQGSSFTNTFLSNCAATTNTSGTKVGTLVAANVTGFVTLSADPFVSAASGNFALNATAGGGAGCRAAGIPGAFPGGTTTGYADIGAAQHADAGGGLLVNPGMSGGIRG